MKTGEYIGPDYAGGFAFGPDNLTAGWMFTAPNLTNDPEEKNNLAGKPHVAKRLEEMRAALAERQKQAKAKR